MSSPEPQTPPRTQSPPSVLDELWEFQQYTPLELAELKRQVCTSIINRIMEQKNYPFDKDRVVFDSNKDKGKLVIFFEKSDKHKDLYYALIDTEEKYNIIFQEYQNSVNENKELKKILNEAKTSKDKYKEAMQKYIEAQQDFRLSIDKVKHLNNDYQKISNRLRKIKADFIQYSQQDYLNNKFIFLEKFIEIRKRYGKYYIIIQPSEALTDPSKSYPQREIEYSKYWIVSYDRILNIIPDQATARLRNIDYYPQLKKLSDELRKSKQSSVYGDEDVSEYPDDSEYPHNKRSKNEDDSEYPHHKRSRTGGRKNKSKNKNKSKKSRK